MKDLVERDKKRERKLSQLSQPTCQLKIVACMCQDKSSRGSIQTTHRIMRNNISFIFMPLSFEVICQTAIDNIYKCVLIILKHRYWLWDKAVSRDLKSVKKKLLLETKRAMRKLLYEAGERVTLVYVGQNKWRDNCLQVTWQFEDMPNKLWI